MNDSPLSRFFFNTGPLGPIIVGMFHLLPLILSCISMVVGLVWTTIMIWESRTAQSFVKKWKNRNG